ncbi:marine proteobacterial sortase target protein [Zavarzinia sp. CC-PAN008]|uniref:marine proteobacterial sortase target protein n=1 Tax=Zavarzinia sp. CC-PAN008 TaxID=3243332 RepID=UPI003F748A38
MSLDEVTSGALLLKGTEPGAYVEAPRLGTDVDLTVSGPTARGRLTQAFTNPTSGWVEAVYVFPLPSDSAVDTLRMVVGDRVIVGEIKERQQAQAIYQEAKAAGQKAGLIEQERPNLFTSSVANIGPGETVVVQLEFQEPVKQTGDVFSLRVPMVVAPRYNPPPVVQTVDLVSTGGGWGTVSDPVPDRDRIEPPVRDPVTQGRTNPVTVGVTLRAGFPLGEVRSLYHPVKSTDLPDGGRRLDLAEGPVPADRDFVLEWQAAAAQAPQVGLFRETVDGQDYILATLTAPSLKQQDERRPREAIFVIDNSGSMGGTSMDQAKQSLDLALARLDPRDTFNVVRFDDTMETVFPAAVPADAEHVEQARRFVRGLEASGGTEMVPALEAALTDARGDATRVRQVIFLTDGAIGNEQQMFDLITSRRGRSRIFMVGIGSAPNSYLMTKAAELGRGTFTHIGSVDEVASRMAALFERLEAPAVTNVQATFSDAGAVERTPQVLPDLYRGEPLVLLAKVERMTGTLEIGGTIGQQPWAARLNLANAAEGAGLAKLWARRRIDDVEVSPALLGVPQAQADQQVLKLALDYGLVTRLTSLVAVDRTPSRPAGARLTRADVPLNLPAGWDFEKVFGPREVVPERRADLGGIQVAAAPQAPQDQLFLPRTATSSTLLTLLGAILLTLSLGLAVLDARRRRVS